MIIEGKTLIDGDIRLNLEFDIDEVIKSGVGYIIMYDYMECDFNIDSYDFDGNKLWNINDILKLEFDDAFVGIRPTENMDNCVNVQAYSGFIYCIDIEKKEVIDKIFIK